jgi:hypothetical protein
MIVSDAIKAAAVLMNDPNQVTWTNDILLGVALQAYEELSNDLVANGFRLFKEITSAPLLVTSPNTTFDAPPTDLFVPISLEERNVGDATYISMEEKIWEPSTIPSTSLKCWSFRKNVINFIGATVDREVRMKYIRNNIGVITNENSILNITNGAGLLGAKIASLAATHLAKNPKDGIAKEGLYITRLTSYIQIELGNQQGKPVRRLPYRVAKLRSV